MLTLKDISLSFHYAGKRYVDSINDRTKSKIGRQKNVMHHFQHKYDELTSRRSDFKALSSKSAESKFAISTYFRQSHGTTSRIEGIHYCSAVR